MNFWQQLKKPFFVLAPMDDVTDYVFREVVADEGRPDVFFTEFTNVDGLQSPGKDALLTRLKFSDKQRPIIAQIWGLKPENYFKSAQNIKDMGFGGVDINMGCPVKDVVRMGACSALIQNPNLAKEIIQATIEGAGGLPVSVKTRLGMKEYQPEWIEFLLKQDLAALTIHGRTVKDMSKVPAKWELIAEVKKIRDQLGAETVIIGNGDVGSREHGLKLADESGVDGIMIGRGIFNDIHIFNTNNQPMTIKYRVDLLLRHAQLFNKTWQGKKNFNIMKKFAKIYIKDFDGAAELRVKVMECKTTEELESICLNFVRS